MLSNEIKEMSTQQRLALMEQLWVSLDEDGELKSPDWHRDILVERTKIMQSGNAEYISLEELKNNK